jgi:hypothetical protein
MTHDGAAQWALVIPLDASIVNNWNSLSKIPIPVSSQCLLCSANLLYCRLAVLGIAPIATLETRQTRDFLIQQ